MQHKIKNFSNLIGKFESAQEEEIYRVIERKFQLKQWYSERDWLTQNRQEVPQSFPEYDRTQLKNSRLPRIRHVKVV